jgi:hypothetical protein
VRSVLRSFVLCLFLSHVRVSFRAGADPVVTAAVGDYEVQAKTIDWHIPLIMPGDEFSKNGTLEFQVSTGGEDVSAFFPVAVEFVSQQSISGVEVSEEKNFRAQLTGTVRV